MNGWKRHLKADPTAWLLESDNPSVRCFTLTDILGTSPRSPAVRDARRALMVRGPVPVILRRQHDDGGWAPRHRFYTSKYWGTVWQLIILAELGADPKNPRVNKACRYIVENSWVPKAGGFASRPAANGGDDERVAPCLTGNMVYSLIRLGHLDDRHVHKSIGWIARHLRADDGDSEPPASHRYRHHTACFGRHTCFHGVVKGLKALAELPQPMRSPAVRRCIKRGAEFTLKHRVYRSSHDPQRIAHSGWASFGFPNMWNTDALEILDILTRLGFRDRRMQQAIDLVVKKQDDRGRWKLDQTWNGKTLVDIERKGKPSKWITLSALRVLKRFYSSGWPARVTSSPLDLARPAG